MKVMDVVQPLNFIMLLLYPLLIFNYCYTVSAIADFNATLTSES